MPELWDPTKPAAGGPRASVDLRQNWRSIERAVMRSLAADPLFLLWGASAPIYWTKSGTGATVTQCGPALADTKEFGLGGYSAKLAYGSALAKLSQVRVASLPTYWRGKEVAIAAYGLASSINTARLYIDDGVTVHYSDYISATADQWATLVATLDAAATKIEIGIELTSGSVYVEGMGLVTGPIPPQHFIPGGGGFYQGATFSSGAGLSLAQSPPIFIAPAACSVAAVRGRRIGGTGATINARRNGADNHLSSALSLTSAATWMDGGAVQNAAYVAGDTLDAMLVTATGTPTDVAVLVYFMLTGI